MSLFWELASALERSVSEGNTNDQLNEIDCLLKRVRDLDSVLYLPHKCALAGCDPSGHYCGQGVGVEAIATAAAEDLKAPDSNSFLVVMDAIQQALGNIDISSERKNISARLDSIGKAIREKQEVGLDELAWIHSVASRLLQLYAKEASNSFCRAHNQQHNYCAQCLNTFMVRSFKAIAQAVKAVCTPEQIDAISSKASPETSFVTYLRTTEVASDKPRDGGF